MHCRRFGGALTRPAHASRQAWGEPGPCRGEDGVEQGRIALRPRRQHGALGGIAGHAGFGACTFLLSAIWLTVKASRRPVLAA